MSKRLNAPLQTICKQFQNNMVNLKPKIHAEIQLVFFYEQRTDIRRPRVICSSKSACFLCNLFIRLHGKFVMAKTHGVLYSKWTLPDINDLSLSRKARQDMNRLTDTFRNEIRLEIHKNLPHRPAKRMHPMESLVSLQRWSGTNISVTGRSAAGGSANANAMSNMLIMKVLRSDQSMDKGGESTANANQSIQGHLIEADTMINNEKGMLQDACYLKSRALMCTPISTAISSQLSTSSLTSDDGHHTKVRYSYINNIKSREVSFTNVVTAQEPTKDRLRMDLDCREQSTTIQSMTDHGSRSRDVLVADDPTDLQQPDEFCGPCATSTRRRIDFHELELFMESEQSMSPLASEMSPPAPGSVHIDAIVHINSLVTGEDVLKQSSRNPDESRFIVLNMQCGHGKDRWWRITWSGKNENRRVKCIVCFVLVLGNHDVTILAQYIICVE